MTDIEHFEDFTDDFGCAVRSPEWLIVHGNKVDDYAWDDASLYLAYHDPLVGFTTIRGELLHNVTHFTITDIPIEL